MAEQAAFLSAKSQPRSVCPQLFLTSDKQLSFIKIFEIFFQEQAGIIIFAYAARIILYFELDKKNEQRYQIMECFQIIFKNLSLHIPVMVI